MPTRNAPKTNGLKCAWEGRTEPRRREAILRDPPPGSAARGESPSLKSCLRVDLGGVLASCAWIWASWRGLPRVAGRAQRGAVQPRDIQVIGHELALKWDDNSEQFVSLETLRRFCPCAACMGEKDIFGTTYKPPERAYGGGAFELAALHPVGGYAVQPAWRDGHNTGIYSWEWLRRVAGAEAGMAGGGCDGHGPGHEHHQGHGQGHGHACGGGGRGGRPGGCGGH